MDIIKLVDNIRLCADMLDRKWGYIGSDSWLLWVSNLEQCLFTLAKVEYLTEA